MTAQEFGLHHALEAAEPLPRAQWLGQGTLLAAVANGPLKMPEERLWKAADFVPDPWAPEPAPVAPAPQPQTVDQIMAAARAAGMT